MAQELYSQMNTLVRVKESKMLSRAQKLSLIHAQDVSSAVRQLGEAGFFAFSPVPSVADYPSALTAEKKGWIAWVGQLSPNKALSEYFMLRDTVTCLKGMLAQRLKSRDYSPSEDMALIYPAEELRMLAQDSPKAAELFGQDWITAVREAAQEYEGSGLFGAEYRLDRFYVEKLLSYAEELGDKGISSYTSAYADIYHLSVLLQSRELEIKPPRWALLWHGEWSGELSGLFSMNPQEQDALVRSRKYAPLWEEQHEGESSALFDVRADNFLLSLCKNAKLEAFGLFPMFGFMAGKLAEIADVRLILSGKSWRLPDGEIEKRMRDSYEL